MSTSTESKALVIQRVSIEVAVAIEAKQSDFDGITFDDLRERIEGAVAARVPSELLAAASEGPYARRGPSGYRFFPPGADRPAQTETPLALTLTELGFKES